MMEILKKKTHRILDISIKLVSLNLLELRILFYMFDIFLVYKYRRVLFQ